MIIVYTTLKFLTLLLLINKINICKKGSVKFFYGKNSFISIILKEQEENKENRGSVEFQVVSFTNKIRRLTSHLELHKKDYLSQRGLRKILGKRQRLLAYLSKKKNRVRYKELIGQLDIRERKTR
ncbi:putative ribosomal protein S15 [Helianthus annuus]|nr:putative ribosomal protein S15 [Helianthus annuus]